MTTKPPRLRWKKAPSKSLKEKRAEKNAKSAAKAPTQAVSKTARDSGALDIVSASFAEIGMERAAADAAAQAAEARAGASS